VRRLQLAAQPDRLLVDDDHIGVEGQHGLLDDVRAQTDGAAEIEIEMVRLVAAVAALLDAGNADIVDAVAELEARDHRRARDDDHRDVRKARDQRVGDRPAAADMAEPEGVVAVDQDPGSMGAARRPLGAGQIDDV